MCVFNIHVVDTDTEYNYGKIPRKILSRPKRHKKGKCLETFLEIQRHFIPLFFSVDGVVGRETNAATKLLDDALSKKW